MKANNHKTRGMHTGMLNKGVALKFHETLFWNPHLTPYGGRSYCGGEQLTANVERHHGFKYSDSILLILGTANFLNRFFLWLPILHCNIGH